MAALQHEYLQNQGETYPYAYRLEGDIIWRSNYKHTGIYYTHIMQDKVIHALGYPCRLQDGSQGRKTPEECLVHGPNEQKYICGVQRVVITPIDKDNFGTLAPDIGRPQP